MKKEYLDIRIAVDDNTKETIKLIANSYGLSISRVVKDILVHFCDDAKAIELKYPRVKNVTALASPRDVNRAQHSLRERLPVQASHNKKQILPNFVITAGRSDRLSAQVKAFLEGEASRKPRWQFDLFSAPSNVRITAYNTTIETSVGSTSFDSYYNDIDHLPRALPFNSWWLPTTETVHVEGNPDYTSYISKDVGSIPFEAASDIMHDVETSVERLGYTFKEAWEFNKQAWLDKQE